MGVRDRYAPSVKHIVAPRIQHHVTEAGPPRVKGVLKVVAILEQRPMMLNAKLICRTVSRQLIHQVSDTYGGDVGELALEGGDIADFEELVVVGGGAVAGDGTRVGLGTLLVLSWGHGGGRKERWKGGRE